MEKVWLARSHPKSAKLAVCVCVNVCVTVRVCTFGFCFEDMSIIRLIGTGNGASLRDREGGNRGSTETNVGETEGIIFLGWDSSVWLCRSGSLSVSLCLSLFTRGGCKKCNLIWNPCDQHVNTTGWWLAAVCFHNSSVYKKKAVWRATADLITYNSCI